MIPTGEDAALTMNASHAMCSTPHLKIERCQTVLNVGALESRFRSVRRAPLIDLPVLNLTEIFAAREFFEDGNRDRLIRDQQRRQTQARLPLPRLKLNRLE